MKPAENLITPAGLTALRARYDHLLGTERPEIVAVVSWAAGNGDRSENGDYIYGKRKLREIDRRIRFLGKRLDAAVVVDNAGKEHERVYFGATVTVADENGDTRTISFPKFFPCSRPMNASGAFSRPSTMSSRNLRRPDVTSGATSWTNAPARSL